MHVEQKVESSEAIYKDCLGCGPFLWHPIPDVLKLGSLTVGAPSLLGLVFIICPMFPCASFLCLLPLAFLYLCPTVVLFFWFCFLIEIEEIVSPQLTRKNGGGPSHSPQKKQKMKLNWFPASS